MGEKVVAYCLEGLFGALGGLESDRFTDSGGEHILDGLAKFLLKFGLAVLDNVFRERFDLL